MGDPSGAGYEHEVKEPITMAEGWVNPWGTETPLEGLELELEYPDDYEGKRRTIYMVAPAGQGLKATRKETNTTETVRPVVPPDHVANTQDYVYKTVDVADDPYGGNAGVGSGFITLPGSYVEPPGHVKNVQDYVYSMPEDVADDPYLGNAGIESQYYLKPGEIVPHVSAGGNTLYLPYEAPEPYSDRSYESFLETHGEVVYPDDTGFDEGGEQVSPESERIWDPLLLRWMPRNVSAPGRGYAADSEDWVQRSGDWVERGGMEGSPSYGDIRANQPLSFRNYDYLTQQQLEDVIPDSPKDLVPVWGSIRAFQDPDTPNWVKGASVFGDVLDLGSLALGAKAGVAGFRSSLRTPGTFANRARNLAVNLSNVDASDLPVGSSYVWQTNPVTGERGLYQTGLSGRYNSAIGDHVGVSGSDWVDAVGQRFKHDSGFKPDPDMPTPSFFNEQWDATLGVHRTLMDDPGFSIGRTEGMVDGFEDARMWGDISKMLKEGDGFDLDAFNKFVANADDSGRAAFGLDDLAYQPELKLKDKGFGELYKESLDVDPIQEEISAYLRSQGTSLGAAHVSDFEPLTWVRAYGPGSYLDRVELGPETAALAGGALREGPGGLLVPGASGLYVPDGVGDSAPLWSPIHSPGAWGEPDGVVMAEPDAVTSLERVVDRGGSPFADPAFSTLADTEVAPMTATELAREVGTEVGVEEAIGVETGAEESVREVVDADEKAAVKSATEVSTVTKTATGTGTDTSVETGSETGTEVATGTETGTQVGTGTEIVVVDDLPEEIEETIIEDDPEEIITIPVPVPVIPTPVDDPTPDPEPGTKVEFPLLGSLMLKGKTLLGRSKPPPDSPPKRGRGDDPGPDAGVKNAAGEELHPREVELEDTGLVVDLQTGALRGGGEGPDVRSWSVERPRNRLRTKVGIVVFKGGRARVIR